YLVTEKFATIDLHPDTVSNAQMGAVFEELIRKFAELSNETAGEHFIPREVIRLMVNVPAINKHLKNIFESGELQREATISKMEMVRTEGGRKVAREVEFYNLDAIIAVGYRVNSYQATQF